MHGPTLWFVFPRTCLNYQTACWPFLSTHSHIHTCMHTHIHTHLCVCKPISPLFMCDVNVAHGWREGTIERDITCVYVCVCVSPVSPKVEQCKHTGYCVGKKSLSVAVGYVWFWLGIQHKRKGSPLHCGGLHEIKWDSSCHHHCNCVRVQEPCLYTTRTWWKLSLVHNFLE